MPAARLVHDGFVKELVSKGGVFSYSMATTNANFLLLLSFSLLPQLRLSPSLTEAGLPFAHHFQCLAIAEAF